MAWPGQWHGLVVERPDMAWFGQWHGLVLERPGMVWFGQWHGLVSALQWHGLVVARFGLPGQFSKYLPGFFLVVSIYMF